jgi:hypothetical protein
MTPATIRIVQSGGGAKREPREPIHHTLGTQTPKSSPLVIFLLDGK